MILLKSLQVQQALYMRSFVCQAGDSNTGTPTEIKQAFPSFRGARESFIIRRPRQRSFFLQPRRLIGITVAFREASELLIQLSSPTVC